ncbi:TPA: hypothetical protein J8125_001664 [Escherichia coli]|nr:hypothetical protein [Escherichia coli]EHM8635970.1 hypothetical protein [Escherichia coli]EHY7503833.1 hypothetical protein [Escherichia coli]EKK3395629.1 hypothetical protein [Escherichia coli]HBA5274478.1 hypothetical protein [Escherichia coli]
MARYGGPFLYPRRFRRTSNNATQKVSAGAFGGVFFYGPLVALFYLQEKKVCLNPYPVPALGGATVFGLFTGTDFGIVFGAFAGALFVATMPQTLSAWRVAAHFLVSFIVGVLGAHVLSVWIASKTGYDGTSADALCAVLVSVVSVKILSFIHQQDIASLVSGLFSRLRGGGGGNVK